MQYDSLSENGIQKVINNAPAIVQIIDYSQKKKADSTFFIVEISDGYSKLKKCVIMNENSRPVKLYDVIKTQVTVSQMNQGKIAHVLIEKYSLLRNDLSSIIGQPIDHLLFQKNKSNPDGDNTIPASKPIKSKTNQLPVKKDKQKQKIEMMNSLFDDEDQNEQKNKKPIKRESLSKNSITQKVPPKQVNSSNNNNNMNPPKQVKPSSSGNPSSTNVNPPKNQQKKSNSSRHQSQYTLIKQLYQGMQDWAIKIRVLFKSEVRTYVKKNNGQQSQVFAFEACDRFDTVEMTTFGEAAGNFSNIIELDQVYEIKGGKVGKDDKKGTLKIMLNDKSTINLLQDDITIPMVDQYCITPEKLAEKEQGSECNVIALVKDTSQVMEFVSRNGKNCKKKQILLCDPEAQIQIPITLWFQKADLKFQKIPYAFQGIIVGSYNQQRQYSTSLRFNFRQYKQHQFRKYVTSYEKMKMDNIAPDYKSKTNSQIFNFYKLRVQAEKLQNNASITIEKICYVTQISLNSKNFYLSCPNCKKKVEEQENGTCMSDKCGKPYTQGKYRYLLNLSLSDEIQTIWCTAYDQAGEVILSSDNGYIMSADQFAKIQADDLKLRMPSFLDRQIKVTVVAKKQSYNGQQRIKYGINKASLELDYGQQTLLLQKKMEQLKIKLGRK